MVEGGTLVADDRIDHRGLIGELSVVGREAKRLLDRLHGERRFAEMSEGLSLVAETLPVVSFAMLGIGDDAGVQGASFRTVALQKLTIGEVEAC